MKRSDLFLKPKDNNVKMKQNHQTSLARNPSKHGGMAFFN